MKYLLLILIFMTSLFANIGKVSAVVGDASIKRANKIIKIEVGSLLEKKDIISTQKNAKVQLIFNDNTIITIGKNSALDIEDYLYDTNNPQNSRTNFNFFKGAFKSITGQIGKINKKKFKLRTSSASIGIRGTIILGNQSVIACTHGGISVQAAGQVVNVNANELTTVSKGKAPSVAKAITTENLTQLKAALEPETKTTATKEATSTEKKNESKEEPETKTKPSAGKPDIIKGKPPIIVTPPEPKPKPEPKPEPEPEVVSLVPLENLVNDIEDSKNNIQTQAQQAQRAQNDASLALDQLNVSKEGFDEINDSKAVSFTFINTSKNKAQAAAIQAQNASDASHSNYNDSTNVSTSDVNVAYASHLAQKNKLQAEQQAQEAATLVQEAQMQYDNLLNDMQTSFQEVSTAKTNALNAKNNALSAKTNAQSQYNQAQASFAQAQAFVQSIDENNAEVKAQAQVLLTQAQGHLDEASMALQNAKAAYINAQNSYDDANTAYTQTQDEYNAFIQSQDVSTAQTHLDEANEAKIQAQNEADNAISDEQFQEAVQAAKVASSNVKTLMTSKVFKSLDASENDDTLDVSLKTFKLSNVKIKNRNIGSNIGGYTGHSQLGTFMESDESMADLFKVQADNLHEFFVGYSDVGNPTKSLFVYGDNFTGSFDNKIYVYKNFKTFNAQTGTNGQLKTEQVYYFYNPQLDSMTALSKDFFSAGAKRFVAGNETTVKTLENEFDTGDDVWVDQINTTTGTGTVDIKGSAGQGLVQTVTSNDGTTDSSELNASFLNGQQDIQSGTINQTLSGVTSMVTYEPSQGSVGTSSANIEITISGNGANISAGVKRSYGSNFIEFEGNVGELSSYYINNDIFGVEAKGLDNNENGFLIAVPDGAIVDGEFVMFDENDNPLTTNDDASWGYWTGKEYLDPIVNSGNSSTGPQTTWIAGVETAESVVNAMMTATTQQTLVFKGKVMGHVDYNPILMDSSNQLQINFNVGAGSNNMTGNMQFKSASSHQFNLDMNFDSVTSTGFSGKFASGDPSYNGFNGKYYGDGEVKSVGGNFYVQDQGKSANGVFKAVKQ